MLARAHRWLIAEWRWPQAGLFTAILLLLLLPALAVAAGAVLAWTLLQLPLYLVHQFEEHRGDRFRRYFNDRVAGVAEGLTPEVTFGINALGVWGVILAAVYLGLLVDPAWGLIAPYLSVINGVLHAAPALVRREYNPGLWTSVALMLPLGGFSLARIATATDAPWQVHAGSAGAVVALHVGIMVYVRLRLARTYPAGPGLAA